MEIQRKKEMIKIMQYQMLKKLFQSMMELKSCILVKIMKISLIFLMDKTNKIKLNSNKYNMNNSNNKVKESLSKETWHKI